jgi:hypothetical protein
MIMIVIHVMQLAQMVISLLVKIIVITIIMIVVQHVMATLLIVMRHVIMILHTVMSLVQQGIRLIVLRLIVKVRGQIQAAVVLLVVMETNCKHTQFL